MPSNLPVVIDSSRPVVEQGRVEALDGIRGIAILSVLAWHFVPSLAVAPIGSPLAYLSKLLSVCWPGVDIFFVLSGYLIGMILIRRRESPAYYRVFYARRALRIMPLYYLLLTGFTVASLFPVMQTIPFFHGWFSSLPTWSYWIFVQNFFMAAANQFGCPPLGVTWSLAVEEQFYLILPFVVRWVAPRHLPLVLIPAILTAPLIRYIFDSGMERYVLLPFRMDSLLLGVLLAWCFAQPGWIQVFAARRRLIAAVTGVLLLMAIPIAKSGAGLAILHTGIGWVLHFWVALVTCGIMILVLLSPSSGIGPRILSFSPLRWAGLRAYGIYLLHPWALYLTFACLGDGEVKLTPDFGGTEVLIATVATFLMAEVSYRWLEEPFRRIGYRLKY